MELAAAQLGAVSSSVVPGSGTWSFAWEPNGVMDGVEAEHIEEAVNVLSDYYDAIGVRLFASLNDREADHEERRLATFAAASSVPVVNLESAFWHPCQELADASTLTQHFGGKTQGKKFVLSWAYHPKALPMAVPNSALMAAARCGMDITVARPGGYGLSSSVMSLARATAESSGGRVEESDDQNAAAKGADVIYAKAWASDLVYDDVGEEAAARAAFSDWRITSNHMGSTNNGIFMHCLPVRRNVVVDTDVLKSPQSVHLTQAGFRLHAQKAILEHVWGLV